MKFPICLLFAAATSSAPVFEDSMAQRTLACSGCHGRPGRAGPYGYYLRIAGKPGSYLYNQLLNYRDGRRHYGLMARLLDPLSDACLLEIARHFAALDLPYPAPQPPRLPTPLSQRGEVLALRGDGSAGIPACAQCHGAALTGVLPNTPGLPGLPRDYLNAGQRRAHAPDCMAQIARQRDPQDLTAVTGWLAAQPLPADPRPAPALARPPGIACGSAALPAGGPQP